MKRKAIFIATGLLIVGAFLFAGLYGWKLIGHAQEALRIAQNDPGVMKHALVPLEERTARWIAEMQEESVEVTLQKLTDAAEYIGSGRGIINNTGRFLFPEDARDSTIYSQDIRAILSNYRFSKAYDALKKIDKQEAAELLSKYIRDNLAELRVELQKDWETVAEGRHIGTIFTVMVIPDPDSYRYSSHPDYPPTRLGRRYAVLSYILLASFLELREVRPAIEEVIELAQETYELFNYVENARETTSFRGGVLEESLYDPSLLLKAVEELQNEANFQISFQDVQLQEIQVIREIQSPGIRGMQNHRRLHRNDSCSRPDSCIYMSNNEDSREEADHRYRCRRLDH